MHYVRIEHLVYIVLCAIQIKTIIIIQRLAWSDTQQCQQKERQHLTFHAAAADDDDDDDDDYNGRERGWFIVTRQQQQQHSNTVTKYTWRGSIRSGEGKGKLLLQRNRVHNCAILTMIQTTDDIVELFSSQSQPEILLYLLHDLQMTVRIFPNAMSAKKEELVYSSLIL